MSVTSWHMPSTQSLPAASVYLSLVVCSCRREPAGSGTSSKKMYGLSIDRATRSSRTKWAAVSLSKICASVSPTTPS